MWQNAVNAMVPLEFSHRTIALTFVDGIVTRIIIILLLLAWRVPPYMPRGAGDALAQHGETACMRLAA